MMTKSQKIARFFEIVNYVMLIPAGLGILASLLLLSSAPWFPLVILIISAFGLMLLIRYFKHSRGRLAEEKIAGMWIGTIVYNLLFLLPSLCITFYGAFTGNLRFSIVGWPFVGFFIFVWWIVSVVGSAIALKSSRSDQKYR